MIEMKTNTLTSHPKMMFLISRIGIGLAVLVTIVGSKSILLSRNNRTVNSLLVDSWQQTGSQAETQRYDRKWR